ncbi:MAG: methyltransferase domain-containing protein, partial [Parcubacteria group bacterium]|nr:methyltransferase domain-containing protein [Parcubacteria group bacterium]
MDYNELIEQLIKNGYLKTPHIINAFKKIDRAHFILPDYEDEAYGNYPLSIGSGQTISQPATVAYMIEKLAPKVGDSALDVGSGSGYTTALLAEIVGSAGKVYAIERIDELKEFGEENASRYGFVKEGRAVFVCGDGSKGLKEYAPFDVIHVGAAAA